MEGQKHEWVKQLQLRWGTIKNGREYGTLETIWPDTRLKPTDAPTSSLHFQGEKQILYEISQFVYVS